MAPDGPRGPAGPAGPAGPCGPVGPAGSWPGAKSTRVSELFATFAELTALFAIFGFVTEALLILAATTALLAIFAAVTALFLSCGVPTLLFASWLTAATLVPPSETRRAKQATIIAGDGRRRRVRISDPFRGLLAFEATRGTGGQRLLPARFLRFPYARRYPERLATKTDS